MKKFTPLRHLLLFTLSTLTSSHTITAPCIIVLNGTSCAGKSTLSSALGCYIQQTLPNTVLHEATAEEIACSHNPNTSEKNSWQIVHVDDFFEYLQENPSLNITNKWKYAVEKTIVHAKQLVANGSSVILDICLTHQYEFDLLNGTPHLNVLIYAPLPTLCARDAQRSLKSSRPYKRQVWCRHYILECFKNMYKPLASPSEESFGTLSYEDLATSALLSSETCNAKEMWLNNTLTELQEKMVQHFTLHPQQEITVTSSIPYDCSVKSDEPIELSVQKIIDWLRTNL